MSIINLAVGKSKYRIDCKQGEEEKIQKLAAKLNERVNNLTLALRGADEKTILMLCAIMAEEEIENLKKPLGDEGEISSQNFDVINDKDLYEGIAENMENIAIYVESLAKKIKNY